MFKLRYSDFTFIQKNIIYFVFATLGVLNVQFLLRKVLEINSMLASDNSISLSPPFCQTQIRPVSCQCCRWFQVRIGVLQYYFLLRITIIQNLQYFFVQVFGFLLQMCRCFRTQTCIILITYLLYLARHEQYSDNNEGNRKLIRTWHTPRLYTKRCIECIFEGKRGSQIP